MPAGVLNVLAIMLDLTELLRGSRCGSSLGSGTSVDKRRLNESIEISSEEDDGSIYFDMCRVIFFKMHFVI
jgi:hypothetical protein